MTACLRRRRSKCADICRQTRYRIAEPRSPSSPSRHVRFPAACGESTIVGGRCHAAYRVDCCEMRDKSGPVLWGIAITAGTCAIRACRISDVRMEESIEAESLTACFETHAVIEAARARQSSKRSSSRAPRHRRPSISPVRRRQPRRHDQRLETMRARRARIRTGSALSRPA